LYSSSPGFCGKNPANRIWIESESNRDIQELKLMNQSGSYLMPAKAKSRSLLSTVADRFLRIGDGDTQLDSASQAKSVSIAQRSAPEEGLGVTPSSARFRTRPKSVAQACQRPSAPWTVKILAGVTSSISPASNTRQIPGWSRRACAGLAQQAFLLSRPVEAKHLERDFALQLRVLGAVHPPHAALAQDAHDLEAADAPASGGGWHIG
jgi:hypothetical protein